MDSIVFTELVLKVIFVVASGMALWRGMKHFNEFRLPPEAKFTAGIVLQSTYAIWVLLLGIFMSMS